MSDKNLVARQAARQIESGMLVGLGTGSTADLFIEALARRHREEGLQITTVSSSPVSAVKAEQLGLPQIAVEQVVRLDVYVDGADEVAPDLTLLKGRGQDLVREKLLARAAERFWVLIDASKEVGRIGARFPIPVEVWPFAWRAVRGLIGELGGTAELRLNQAGVAVTSAGGMVLDCRFSDEPTPEVLDALLSEMPGVMEHGIFHQLATTVLVAADGQVCERHAT
ncbi:ribose 5-phosphate isomerase A [Methylomarinovum caldicuralii]|uniref:Ribose 5-phosphate isomerase A n=1 Tax=Methylomarinovum caldicuralii TaxID=438856 RepID=A0AAU9CPS6_9GAMM|nr:ribose-5-phosphate isomerase RpiA [Methylomarinovum caldicuralii]BCX81938.1 ribose 5-phosphate isomerase A [Methylomarinovum caldicuralii]